MRREFAKRNGWAGLADYHSQRRFPNYATAIDHGLCPAAMLKNLTELLLGLAGAFECHGRNARLQLWVEHDLDHPIVHSEDEHARMKVPVPDLAGDFEEGERGGGYGTGQNDVGRDRVLVAKRSEGEGVRLSGGQKNPDAGRVGVMNEHVGALCDLRQGRLLRRTDIVKVTRITGQNPALGPYRKKPAL